MEPTLAATGFQRSLHYTHEISVNQVLDSLAGIRLEVSLAVLDLVRARLLLQEAVSSRIVQEKREEHGNKDFSREGFDGVVLRGTH
jgi:hypothetical protein